MNENDNLNQRSTFYNQIQTQPQSQPVSQSQSQSQNQTQIQPQHLAQEATKHKNLKTIGMVLLTIAILLGLYSTYIIVQMIRCNVSGCGDAIFVLIPTLLAAFSLFMLSTILISAGNKKTQEAPKKLYIRSAILFGGLGIHDFIVNRRKQAFIHLSLIGFSIILAILGGMITSRPLTDEECARTGGISKLNCDNISVAEYIPGAHYYTLASNVLFVVSYIYALTELSYSKRLSE